MTGPKHLWSGNWQQESADPPTEATPPAPTPAEPAIRRPRRKLWRSAAPLMAVALLAGVALAWVVTGGSGGQHSPGHPNSAASVFPSTSGPTLTIPRTTPTTPAPPPTGLTGRSVNWLGMQISTVQNVGAVIQTVALGSSADIAGLEPGDVIETVNRHSVSAAQQIRTAVAGLKQGQAVAISVERGSTYVSTTAGIQGHPTTSP